MEEVLDAELEGVVERVGVWRAVLVPPPVDVSDRLEEAVSDGDALEDFERRAVIESEGGGDTV